MIPNVDILIPCSLDEAVRRLESMDAAVPLAGGTELIPSMRARKKAPDSLIALDGLNLAYISSRQDAVELGAMTTMSQILASSELRTGPLSLLQKAISQAASWQIRNAATIGGSLASGIPGLDPITALLALDARVRLISGGGCREVPVSAFFPAPMKTVLQKGELILSVILPRPEEGDWRVWFRKVGIRKAYTMLIVNMASMLLLEDGMIRSWRLAAGGVSPVSLLLDRTAGQAVGKRLDEVDPEQLKRCLQQEISPEPAGGAEYKRILCGNLLCEILEDGRKMRE